MQFYFHAIIFQRRYRRGRAGMVVTNLRRDFDWLGQLVERMPVAIRRGEFIAVERGIVADDDAIVLRIQLHDINRLARRDAESFALANGVKCNAVMLAEHMAVQIHNLDARFLHEVRLLEKAAVIVVRHETDFHALLLVGGLEIAMPRHFARVALGLFAEWKNRARKLILPQREKKITLILPQIASALQQISHGSRCESALIFK